MSKKTLTYSDQAKGWTSFWSWFPDWMGSLNNRFFSIKNGQLYIHNDETNPVRNNFYGEQFGTKIVAVINEESKDDKIFKTLVLEGNRPWNASIKTNLAESTIAASEFNAIESRHFAHIRQNENASDHHGLATQGIGVIQSSAGLTVTFNRRPEFTSTGDSLYQLNGNNQELIGVISDISGSTLTLSAIITAPVTGFFSFSQKNSRVEGGDIRGYYALVTLENRDTGPVELFAIESNAVKSHV